MIGAAWVSIRFFYFCRIPDPHISIFFYLASTYVTSRGALPPALLTCPTAVAMNSSRAEEDWLTLLFAKAIESRDARAWLFDTADLRPSSTLRSSANPPVFLQISFGHDVDALAKSPRPPPSVRDVLVLVKDGPVPLLAGFGVFPDPVGPTVAAVSGERALGVSETSVYRTVLVGVKGGGAVLLSFAWKRSGALIVRSHTVPPANGGRAPVVSSMLSRCYAVPEAAALLFAARSSLALSSSAFLTATLPCLNPRSAFYWDVVGYDARAQAPCFFCFSRGILSCACPSPMRRRVTRDNDSVAIHLGTSSSPYRRMLRGQHRDDASGLIFVSFIRRNPYPRGGGPRPPPDVLFKRASSYSVVLDGIYEASPTIQQLVSLSEQLRSLEVVGTASRILETSHSAYTVEGMQVGSGKNLSGCLQCSLKNRKTRAQAENGIDLAECSCNYLQ